MIVNLDQHILHVLANTPAGARPVTISDFARQFGVSAIVVRPAARRLVDEGLVVAAFVDVQGVKTLHGLLPLRVPATVAE